MLFAAFRLHARPSGIDCTFYEGGVVSGSLTPLVGKTHRARAVLLTLGIAGAIWSSSAAMVAIIDALNHAYDIDERRSWWRRRVVAIVVTVALALFIVMSLAFVLAGPSVAS